NRSTSSRRTGRTTKPSRTLLVTHDFYQPLPAKASTQRPTRSTSYTTDFAEALGVPLAVGISLLGGVEGLFIRKSRKQYGTFRRVEGVLRRSGGVVVIDDVVRSGTQMLAAIAAVRSSGLQVVGALCVLERPGMEEPCCRGSTFRSRPCSARKR
ncbi:MAG: hypothetical protein ACRDRY_24455, partial [Pseudonocardiaceae bacterium]